MGRLTRSGYEQLIREDIEWLLRQPRTLERDHIEAVLRDSPARLYDDPPPSPSPSHCPTCICGKRAPVQRSIDRNKPDGSISWEEHEEAYAGYATRYGRSQSAERIAERGGFSYGELILFLGREPATWSPRRTDGA